MGWVDLGPTYAFVFSGWVGPDLTIWAGPNQVRPTIKVNYLQNVNNSSSHSTCNQNGCRRWRWRRRRIPETVVMTLIRRLSWWFGLCRCEERWKSWRSMVEEGKEEEENMQGKEGGVRGGWFATGEGLGYGRWWCSSRWWLWWRPKVTAERERRERELVTEKLGRGSWFSADFAPDFLHL